MLSVNEIRAMEGLPPASASDLAALRSILQGIAISLALRDSGQ